MKVSSTTEVPAPNTGAEGSSTRVFVTPGDQATQVISAVPAIDAGPPKSRRRLLLMTGFTVVVFAIGMLAITGIELVKGSPLNTSSSSTSQRSGTSLGSVLGKSGSASTETSSETETTSETTSEKSTTEATTTDEPSDEDATTAEPGTGFGADEEPTTTRSRPTPTPTPTADSGSDQGTQSDGGAAAPDQKQ
jgi:cytoskeletal protein RodZ